MCERIPYLILPVRRLSREPFGIHRSAGSEPSGRCLARLDLTIALKCREQAAGQDAELISIEPPAEATNKRAIR